MKKVTRSELADAVRGAYLNGEIVLPHSMVHIGAALRLIEGLIKRAEETHEPMDWKKIGAAGNLERAEAHRLKFRQLVIDDEDHLLNQTCRLLMSIQMREEEKQNATASKHR